jgi:hypothetical protein
MGPQAWPRPSCGYYDTIVSLGFGEYYLLIGYNLSNSYVWYRSYPNSNYHNMNVEATNINEIKFSWSKDDYSYYLLWSMSSLLYSYDNPSQQLRYSKWGSTGSTHFVGLTPSIWHPTIISYALMLFAYYYNTTGGRSSGGYYLNGGLWYGVWTSKAGYTGAFIAKTVRHEHPTDLCIYFRYSSTVFKRCFKDPNSR